MDGDKAHADLKRYFPGATSVEHEDDIWVTVAYGDTPGRSWPSMARCPVCAQEKFMASIRDRIPPRFRKDVTLPPCVEAWAQRGHDAQGLYLAGQVGTGKTQIAWAAAIRWCAALGLDPDGDPNDYPLYGRVLPSLVFTRLTDLLDDLRPGDDAKERIADCQRASLLVIDDIGAEKPSEWTRERLYGIIDNRYAGCLPLIVTSNLPLGEPLAEVAGDRVASRLAEMCEVVPVTGGDRRRVA